MKFDKQQITIIVIAGLIIGGFVIFQYYPMFREAMNIREAKAKGQASSVEMGRKAEEFEEMRSQIAELKSVDETFGKSIPAKPDFAKLWSEITEIMNEHNLRDHLVQPGKEEQGQKLNCSPLKIECTGTMEQIFGLFESLDKQDRKIRIESVDMTNDQEYSGLIKLVANAKIYYQVTQEKAL